MPLTVADLVPGRHYRFRYTPRVGVHKGRSLVVYATFVGGISMKDGSVHYQFEQEDSIDLKGKRIEGPIPLPYPASMVNDLEDVTGAYPADG
jgi:hypothetical protein